MGISSLGAIPGRIEGANGPLNRQEAPCALWTALHCVQKPGVFLLSPLGFQFGESECCMLLYVLVRIDLL